MRSGGVYDGCGPAAGMVAVGYPDGGSLIELSGRASSSGSKGEEGASTARAEAERITTKASKMQICVLGFNYIHPGLNLFNR